MTKVAFAWGIITFHWYGLIVAGAVLIGLLVSIRQARIYNRPMEPVIDFFLYGAPIAILSARLYFVAANWKFYAHNPGEIFLIWHGGLALHGALIGLVLVLVIYTRRHKLPFWEWADILAPGLAISQAIGEWGNFINQDAFGYPTNGPWGIYIDFAERPLGFKQFDFFQPAFLYESIVGATIFFLILLGSYLQFSRRGWRIRSGSFFLGGILLYSLGRFFIEGIRIDSEMVAGYRLGQLVCAALAVVAVLLLGRRYWRLKTDC